MTQFYKLISLVALLYFFNYSNGFSGNLIIVQPTSIQQCEGIDNQYFEIIPNVDLNINDFYVQWYKENVKFGSFQKNSAKLLLPKLTYDISGDYYAEIWTVTKNSDPNINIIDLEKSEKALLYVNNKTKIIKQPKKDNYVVLGGNVSVSFEAHLVNNQINPDNKNSSNLIEIQWLKGNNIIQESNRISGTKSSLLNINNVTTADFGDDYRVVVKSLCGSDTSDYFSLRNLRISLNLYGYARDYKNCPGSIFNFRIKPFISDGSKLKLQWYYDDKLLVDGPNISGAQTDSLTIQLFDNKPIYLIAESEIHQIKERFDTWNLLDQKIDENSDISSYQLIWYVNQGPIILEQPGPKDTILQEGENLDLLFKTDNLYGNMFKWYKDGVLVQNTPNRRLYIGDIKPSDAGKYYCEAINKCGSTFTDTINVTVNTSAIYSGIEGTSSSLTIFPNPTSDRVSVDLGVIAVADLSIYDILGNEIMSIPNYTNKSEIDVSTIPIGTYTIQIQTKTGSVSQRLLVNR